MIVGISGEADAVDGSPRFGGTGRIEFDLRVTLFEQDRSFIPGERPVPKQFHRVQLIDTRFTTEEVLCDVAALAQTDSKVLAFVSVIGVTNQQPVLPSQWNVDGSRNLHLICLVRARGNGHPFAFTAHRPFGGNAGPCQRP